MIRAAVLGSPISHSLSPTLHRRAYQILGIEGMFEAIEVKEAELATFIASRDEKWTGFSLTMPLKEEVMKIATVISPIAKQVSSANTLTRKGSQWSATSTDVNGFVEALKQHGVSKVDSIAIIGSGATARAAAAASEHFTEKIEVIHRSASREIAMRAAAPHSEMLFRDWNSAFPEADVVINTTPKGVADIFVDRIIGKPIFFEALYNPWPTKLLESARENGSLGIDGLDLLIHQGIDQVHLMSGLPVDREELAPLLRGACLEKLGL